ncbi:unnamed protein product [Acanthosepion pharaonis]|uniref:Uncharacterized protein n=1 Tax=Acanthosepion pharaonis TaxID=158019 RepID=A0A812BED8_ACAPH|nr:unnamed protein product [Sepia pharaonis]
MYVGLCVRIPLLCVRILAFVSIRLIYVILYVRIPCYVCGPMRPYSCLMYVGLCIRIPLLCICVYTVNICDSIRPDPCYVCGPMRPYSCLMYVGLCIRIPLLCICVYTVNICDSIRPDPCYVCGPMRPYSCLMYVGLCIRIPLLCICVYTVNICDSMRPDPCYVCGPMRPYSCLMYVGLCIRIPCYAFVSIRLIYVILYVRIPVMYAEFLSMRPYSFSYLMCMSGSLVCGPMRPYSCLMYVGIPLVMHLCLYG